MMAETWCGVDDMAAYIFAMMDIEYDGEDWTYDARHDDGGGQ